MSINEYIPFGHEMSVLIELSLNASVIKPTSPSTPVQLSDVTNRNGTSAKCIVTSKTRSVHATVVAGDEPCHFFGHVCKNERAKEVRTENVSEI